MKQKAENYLKLKEIAEKDPQYRQIVGEYLRSEPRFAAVLEVLGQEQREAVLDHLWVVDWAGRYMTLLACGEMVFPEK